MGKIFNVNAACIQELHYMVDITDKLEKIKSMVDAGQYFTINRARQYGKTTTLRALRKLLEKDYVVVSLDFQLFGEAKFKNENIFSLAFGRSFLRELRYSGVDLNSGSAEAVELLDSAVRTRREDFELQELFEDLSDLCRYLPKRVVLMIDEVDSAANNQVFIDFLAQLRGYYIQRDEKPSFQSVILAGVYDIKNVKRKFVSEKDHQVNSPWNIAADFLVDMSFSIQNIHGMLMEYEADHKTGMDMVEMASVIYDYTSGYPYLVSRICKLMDERLVQDGLFTDEKDVWTKEGILKAVNILISEKNTLFDSLMEKLDIYPQLRDVLHLILFQGNDFFYNPDDEAINIACMFGFIKVTDHNRIEVANRIFETRIYNYFLSLPESQNCSIYTTALHNKNQFIQNGHLNMRLILEKFVIHFDDLYGDQTHTFYEEDGRRYFLLYLRPIINGVGNYYIEARTRNMERTDVIIDYLGEQTVVELKVWRGNAYHTRGEEQLSDYLEYYHLNKGYMLSFNFNKKKEIGVKEIKLGNKLLIEAVV